MKTLGKVNSFFMISGVSLIMSLLAQPTSAATIHVSPSGSHASPYDTWSTAATNIAAAVSAASSGDTILVTNGTYALSAPVLIDRQVTLRSVNGARVTAIDGQDAVQCIRVTATNVVVEGFTIRRGTALYGGGIRFEAEGTLKGCVVEFCSAPGVAPSGQGGGASLEAGGLVEYCTFASNNASGYGGGVHLNDGATLRNCVIVKNVSYNGGGLVIWGSGGMESCTVVANVASNYGGGIMFQNGGWARNCVVYHNTAAGESDISIFGASFPTIDFCCTPGRDKLGAGNLTNVPPGWWTRRARMSGC